MSRVGFLVSLEACEVAALQVTGLFAEAFIAYGIVSWPNGYDIAPETLRRYAQQGFAG